MSNELPRELMESCLAASQEATFQGFDDSVLKEIFAGQHRRLFEAVYRMGFESGWRIREKQIEYDSKADFAGKHEAPALKEIELNIIRFWPDGMPERLEHVWRDLVGFIPNYKLYDLQRVLAEFGFTMKIYENVVDKKEVE